jgi:hypothetical protein
MFMADVWQWLSLYESTDLVARFYKEHHRSRLKEEKATEIVSQLAQGREYFSSAARSADIVRPLLTYYGVLSLTRGLILFLNANIREAGLSTSHGLGTVSWGQQLAKGITELPNLQVRFQKGTFTELSKVTGNTERTTLRTGRNPPSGDEYRHPYEQGGTEDIPVELEPTVTIKDILARIPDLDELYEYTFEEYSGCYPTELFVNTLNSHTDVAVIESRGDELDEKSIRDALHIPSEIPLRHEEASSLYLNILEDVGHWLFTVHQSSIRELPQKLPVVVDNRMGRTFLLAPLANGLRLSSLSLLFITSYVMGMLVRYYPSQWLALLGRSKGDISYPLLKAAMTIVEHNFPELVLEEFELRNPVARRRDFGGQLYP